MARNRRTTSGVQSKIEEAPPGGGTSLVAQVVVHEFWGAEQTSQWWRKLVVAQVGGGARWFWWRKFGAGWLGASLAQVALKLGAETCAKLAPPSQLAPNLRHRQLAPNLRHHQLAPPLVPPPGGASIKLLCTPKFVHQHLSATTNLRHHLRHQLAPPNLCHHQAVPPQFCSAPQTLCTNTFPCHQLVPRPTCDTNLCHHHPASAHPKPCLGEVGSEGEGRGTETFHGGMQHLSVIQGLCGAGWGGVGAISVFPDSNPCRSHFGYTRTCPSP